MLLVVPARVVVLGGGTGGTVIANRLSRQLSREKAVVTVVDRDDRHLYQPGLLFVPFGRSRPRRLVRSRADQLRSDVAFVRAEVENVDVEQNAVRLAGGDELAYDVLVVASGSVLAPEETEGLPEALGGLVHTFYSLEGATLLSAAIEKFESGRLVINFVDLPIKCPVAPLEFAFLADAYFKHRGNRNKVEIAFVTPLDSAFTKPACARALSGLLDEKGIELVTDFNTGTVNGSGRRIESYDGRDIPFELCVIVPMHSGAGFVSRSDGLGDGLGFVEVDKETLQSKVRPNIFAIGDAADVPTSKAGSVAHFEGEIVADNIRSYLDDEPMRARFDGHTNCFIETGGGQALLIDFNYETEPLPGHFPWRRGLPLLAESPLNHLGKLAFEQLYWHAILPGRDIPGIGSSMPESGKRRDTAKRGEVP